MAPCTKMKQFQGKIMQWVPNFEVNTHGDGMDFAASWWRKKRVFLLWRSNVYHCFWWYLNVFVFFCQVCGGICQYPWLPGLHPCMTTFATNQKSLQKIQRIVGERIDGATLAATPILGGFFTEDHDVHHDGGHGSGERHRSFPGGSFCNRGNWFLTYCHNRISCHG